CAVSGGLGAAVLLIGDRTVDAQRIDRLSVHAKEMHDLLDALPLPVWLRNGQLGLTYANRAYRDAVEAPDKTPYDQLPEIAAATGAGAGQSLAERARA